jgi:GAF domain-containing protein
MIRELQSLTYGRKGRERVGVRAASQTSQRGQSLVETALITPLLLLMFLGVLEVGWALRGYLVLLNTNREATRFAARGAYLDFSQPDIEGVGYELVLGHAMDSLSGQLPLDFSGEEPNATIIMTHMDIDTGYPCVDQNCWDKCNADPDTTYPEDDVIGLPPAVGAGYGGDPAVVISDTFRAQYPVGEPARPTHKTLVTDDLWQDLRAQNEALNCQLMAKDAAVAPSANSVIVVEIFYDQPQLLGVPLISNRFTDPIPLYTQTMMRIVTSRQR